MANLLEPFSWAAQHIGDLFGGSGGGGGPSQNLGFGSDSLISGMPQDYPQKGPFPQGTPYPSATTTAPAPAPAAPRPYSIYDYLGSLPTFDVGGAYASARDRASQVGNAYFTKELNDFLARTATLKNREQTKYSTNISQFDKSLQNFMEESGIKKERTAEDVGYNLSRIAIEEDARQRAEGGQYEQGKRQLGQELGKAGLTTSGLGRQNVQQYAKERQMTEEAAAREIQDRNRSQVLMKERTFADLARGEKLKGEETAFGKDQSKRELDWALEDIAWDEKLKRNELEMKRIELESQNVQNFVKEAYLNYFSRLRSPEHRTLSGQIYGGLF